MEKLHLRQREGGSSSDETGKTWCGRDVLDVRTGPQARSESADECRVCRRAYEKWSARGF